MWERLDLNITRTIAEVLDSAGGPNQFPTRRPRGENIQKTSRKAFHPNRIFLTARVSIN